MFKLIIQYCCIVLLFCICINTNAQQTIQIGANDYYLYDSQWCLMKDFEKQKFLFSNNKWHSLDTKTNILFEIVGDEIAIKFKDGISNSAKTTLENNANITFTEDAAYGNIKYYYVNNNNIFSSFDIVRNSSIVEEAIITSYGKYANIPNDPEFGNQWYLNYPTNPFASIQVDSAWDITTGDSNIIVAVIDDGVDWSHEDLGLGNDSYQNIYLNSGEDAWSDPNDPTTGNGLDDDSNGLVDDWKGWNFLTSLVPPTNGSNNVINTLPYYNHGTIVSGIIAAKRNNGIGIAGIAGGDNSSGVKLLTLKNGDLWPGAKETANAIKYAIAMNADIIQLSAIIDPAQALELNPAIEDAYNAGVLIICAAGNLNPTIPSDTIPEIVPYPANHPLVLTISATDTNGLVTNFSRYGTSVSVAAPGVNLRSIDLANGYTYDSGTSFAAPIVSGVAALMKSANPCLSHTLIKDIIETTADKIGNYDYDWDCIKHGHSKELGHGRINAYQAVKKASELSIPSNADLYIKDNYHDLGKEPNSGTPGWRTPDIVIRQENDSIFETNPSNFIVYWKSEGDTISYIYVRVRNRGCAASLGTEQLKLYWATTGLSLTWPDAYNGQLKYPTNNEPVGGIVDSVTLPVIESGTDIIVEIPWKMPDFSKYDIAYSQDYYTMRIKS